MSGPRQGVISLAIKDKAMLQSSYMPFVKSGGIFIATEKSFELGDEVFLLLTLVNDPERFAITGKVIWINYRTTPGGRQMGVGVQFSGAEGLNLQKKIDALLAGYPRLDQATNTM
ncbi:MAG: PilZ domain-containing protein [Candidatus Competibacter denitrificans]|jgi:type IV pilus assembly protein PilZ|uniref:Type IV pilus assembly PilZ n=1 Tax=Candidatus Competibacter denitrificans Run_A_D11 TaxID=1400863 RepID=W6ME87_9GAMM|nr:PilZ domain-containing protein [Candidatus Competibacter denitrificans]CDI04183.1 Type IV pilus assembly PilZ [Candidatus Competibacter denitrificans Run_A_D11]HAS87274.1 pilus assembly protein PilZ [Candidatus Competibacteraceae bacterium]HRC68715.1 PilZ domain-containing protein [Candidatus Competibacter denitrificans]